MAASTPEAWAEPQSSARLVVIAASAGGLRPLIEVLSKLPADFGAAIAVVQHRGPDFREELIRILGARTPLQVRHASDGVPLEAGVVYVCPPGLHLVVERSLRLVHGPRLNFVRPNADLTLRSAARAYGDRAIGVVLSGAGTDAAFGALALAHSGAPVIAQDPSSCDHSGMPMAVLRVGATDRCLPPHAIASALCALVQAAPGTSTVHGPASDRPGVTRVLLADDHRIILDGLNALLAGEADMQVVGSAEDGESALRFAGELLPDVVVIDIGMPGLDGVTATRRILSRAPAARVLALSSRTDAGTVNDMLGAGATGYVSKQRAFDDLAQAIRSVRRARMYLSVDVAPLVAPWRLRGDVPRGGVASSELRV